MSPKSIIFKVPQAKAFEPLLTDQEVEDLERKIKGVNKLLAKPRASLPALEPFVAQMIQTFDMLLTSSLQPFSEKHREVIENAFKILKLLEDLVIRVIICGASPVDVYMAQMAQLQQSGSFPNTTTQVPE